MFKSYVYKSQQFYSHYITFINILLLYRVSRGQTLALHSRHRQPFDSVCLAYIHIKILLVWVIQACQVLHQSTNQLIN